MEHAISSLVQRSDGHQLQDCIEAIFFDLDNTLVQTRSADEKCIQEVLYNPL